jgi:hypothetical protein
MPSLAELRARYHASVEAVERATSKELAALSDEEALRRTLSMRLFENTEPSTTEWSGLVEQQALFRRMRQP